MSRVVQVRDVPAGVHETLRHKAALRGLSLSAYLREVLEREAGRPSVAEWLDRVGGTLPPMSADEIVDLIHRGRADR